MRGDDYSKLSPKFFGPFKVFHAVSEARFLLRGLRKIRKHANSINESGRVGSGQI